MAATGAQRRIKSISYAKYGYFFILPFFIVYFIFQLWPLINTFVLSFHGNGNPSEKNTTSNDVLVGFDNYSTLLSGGDARNLRMQHEEFFSAFKNTIILWFGNFIPQIILSLSLAAWFTDARLKIVGKGFFKVVMYLPNIITAASVSVLFMSLCSDNGAVNQILGTIGLGPVDFLKGPVASRGTVMFIQTWLWFGNTMIMLMSGIMGISPSLFEAAEIDGATSTQAFWKITIPLLSPIMVYTLVTSMIGGLQMFDIPYLYHTGTEINKNIQTVAVYIFQRYKNKNGAQFGYAGAASVILFIVTLILGSITFYLNRDKDEIAKKKQRKKLQKDAKAKSKQFGGLSI